MATYSNPRYQSLYKKSRSHIVLLWDSEECIFIFHWWRFGFFTVFPYYQLWWNNTVERRLIQFLGECCSPVESCNSEIKWFKLKHWFVFWKTVKMSGSELWKPEMSDMQNCKWVTGIDPSCTKQTVPFKWSKLWDFELQIVSFHSPFFSCLLCGVSHCVVSSCCRRLSFRERCKEKEETEEKGFINLDKVNRVWSFSNLSLYYMLSVKGWSNGHTALRYVITLITWWIWVDNNRRG